MPPLSSAVFNIFHSSVTPELSQNLIEAFVSVPKCILTVSSVKKIRLILLTIYSMIQNGRTGQKHYGFGHTM